jgi:hypothetical protein
MAEGLRDKELPFLQGSRSEPDSSGAKKLFRKERGDPAHGTNQARLILV